MPKCPCFIDMQFQAFDFRTTTRNEPFLQLFHCLFVYPLTVTLSRKRNLFVRVELRKDDADVRRQPLEVKCDFLLILNQSLLQILYDLFHVTCTTNLTRQCIHGNQEHHFRSGLTLRLLLVQEWLAIMMRSKFPFLPYGHHCITFCSLSSMLIFKQSWKLQSQ